MAIQRLSRLSDWKLKNPDQDLRGYDVKTHEGRLVGSVIDMVVDTEARLVTSLVLQNDSHIPTEQIDIKDGIVWVDESVAYTSTSSSHYGGILGTREYNEPGDRFVPEQRPGYPPASGGPTTKTPRSRP